MPELPEVETIRRDLDPHLTGHAVVRVDIRDQRLVSKAAEPLFRRNLCGQPWQVLSRQGKYLVVRLMNGWELIFHLRMTGQLVLVPRVSRLGLKAPWRMLLEFDHGAGLAFYDQRRFGEV